MNVRGKALLQQLISTELVILNRGDEPTIERFMSPLLLKCTINFDSSLKNKGLKMTKKNLTLKNPSRSHVRSRLRSYSYLKVISQFKILSSPIRGVKKGL